MTRGTSLLMCLPLAVALATCGGGAAKPRPVLGSSEKAVNAAWSSDPSNVRCVRENLETTCHYRYRGVHVSVSFDEHLLADQFQTDGRKHPSVDMWTFLNSLVPDGSRRLSCRSVPHAVGGGTARACLYRARRDVIVAYFPHPNDTDFGGLVSYDYEEYKDIQG